MSDQSEAPRVQSLAWGLKAVFLALFCVAAFAAMSINQIRLSDDQLYLMTGGLKLRHADAYARSVDLVESRLADPAVAAEDRYRYQMRFDYTDNYLGASALYAAWFALAPRLGPGPAGSGEIAAASFDSLLFASFLAMLVFSVLASVFLPPRALLAFAAASALGIALSMVLPRHPDFIVFGNDGWAENLTRLVAFVVGPTASSQFSVFGFTPRSQMFLLAALIFMLRWSGRPALGWWLVPLCALIHQSHTTLLVLLLLVLEFVNGPRRLLRTGVLVPVALSLAMTLARERILDSFRVSDVLVFGGLFAALLVTAVVWASLETRLFSRRPGLARRVRELRASRAALLEAGSLAVLWVATLPAGYLACRYSGDLAGKYLWCQVHARVYAMLATPILIALCLGLFALFRRRWPDSTRAGALGVLCAAAGFVAVLAVREAAVFDGRSAMRETAAALDREADGLRIEHLGAAHESVLYFAMVDDLWRGCARLASMLQPEEAAP